MSALKIKKLNNEKGSALILVIALSVLLAVVGIMIIMIARISAMSTSSLANDTDLKMGVNAVVDKVGKTLTEDLFGKAAVDTNRNYLAESTPKAGSGNRPDYTNVDIPNEPWDSPATDRWLADIEPVFGSGAPQWRITDIFDSGMTRGVPTLEILPTRAITGDTRADADGDGVVDSKWLRLSDVTDRKGSNIYAAVRIIDHNAMLNLNTAYGIDPTSDGRYLSSVDFERFLRGSDADAPTPSDTYKLRFARDPGDLSLTPEFYHDNVIMKLDQSDLSPDYKLFGINDELEIRNRFMVSSPAEARFEIEAIANYTLDAGGGLYSALRTPITTRDELGTEWFPRLSNYNFDNSDDTNEYAFYYDRRHITTFYSFDKIARRRMIPTSVGAKNWDVESDIYDVEVLPDIEDVEMAGLIDLTADIYTPNDVDAKKNIVKMLFALKAYFFDRTLSSPSGANDQKAAIQAAQTIVNMIDYTDIANSTASNSLGQQNQDVSYLNTATVNTLISAAGLPAHDLGLGDYTVYGYEKQPFITEVVRWQAPSLFYEYTIELCNPYAGANIDLTGWRLSVGTLAGSNSYEYTFIASENIDAASSLDPSGLGRLLITSDPVTPGVGNKIILDGDPKPKLSIPNGRYVKLERPDPSGGFIVVDQIRVTFPPTSFAPGVTFGIQRQDLQWSFADQTSVAPTDDPHTLGQANTVSATPTTRFQLPVDDGVNTTAIETFADFGNILFVGNHKSVTLGHTTITQHINTAGDDEGQLRFDASYDPANPTTNLFDYFTFMTTPRDTIRLPGRININTAPKHVIAAAIPPDPALDKDPDGPSGPLAGDGNVIDEIYAIADDIIAYRNANSFENLGQLLQVKAITQFSTTDPDYTNPTEIGDTSLDADFQERDYIFAKLANIFTVRSDVFTAYILVRAGAEGPQRRYIAIFDRSKVKSPNDRPELKALHAVADAR